jgi:hypothetical protein
MKVLKTQLELFEVNSSAACDPLSLKWELLPFEFNLDRTFEEYRRQKQFKFFMSSEGGLD